jgi:hypothetical protein
MSESHVVSGLVAKFTKLSTEANHLRLVVLQMESDMDILAATIKMFSPEMDLRSLPPKRYRSSHKVFRQGESGRLILDVLREADGGPLDTLEIAKRIAQAKQLEEAQVNMVRDTVLDALRRAERKGLVRQSGRKGIALLWELV